MHSPAIIISIILLGFLCVTHHHHHQYGAHCATVYPLWQPTPPPELLPLYKFFAPVYQAHYKDQFLHFASSKDSAKKKAPTPEQICSWAGYRIPDNYNPSDASGRPRLRVVRDLETDIEYNKIKNNLPPINEVLIDVSCDYDFLDQCIDFRKYPPRPEFSLDDDWTSDNPPKAVSPSYFAKSAVFNASEHSLLLYSCGSWVPPSAITRVTKDDVSHMTLRFSKALMEDVANTPEVQQRILNAFYPIINEQIQANLGTFRYDSGCARRFKFLMYRVRAEVKQVAVEVTDIAHVAVRLLPESERDGEENNYLFELSTSLQIDASVRLDVTYWTGFCPRIGGLKIKLGNADCSCRNTRSLCGANDAVTAWVALGVKVKVGLVYNETAHAVRLTYSGSVVKEGLEVHFSQACSIQLPKGIFGSIFRRIEDLMGTTVVEYITTLIEQIANTPFSLPFEDTFKYSLPSNFSFANGSIAFALNRIHCTHDDVDILCSAGARADFARNPNSTWMELPETRVNALSATHRQSFAAYDSNLLTDRLRAPIVSSTTDDDYTASSSSSSYPAKKSPENDKGALAVSFTSQFLDYIWHGFIDHWFKESYSGYIDIALGNATITSFVNGSSGAFFAVPPSVSDTTEAVLREFKDQVKMSTQSFDRLLDGNNPNFVVRIKGPKIDCNCGNSPDNATVRLLLGTTPDILVSARIINNGDGSLRLYINNITLDGTFSILHPRTFGVSESVITSAAETFLNEIKDVVNIYFRDQMSMDFSEYFKQTAGLPINTPLQYDFFPFYDPLVTSLNIKVGKLKDTVLNVVDEKLGLISSYYLFYAATPHQIVQTSTDLRDHVSVWNTTLLALRDGQCTLCRLPSMNGDIDEDTHYQVTSSCMLEFDASPFNANSTIMYYFNSSDCNASGNATSSELLYEFNHLLVSNAGPSDTDVSRRLLIRASSASVSKDGKLTAAASKQFCEPSDSTSLVVVHYEKSAAEATPVEQESSSAAGSSSSSSSSIIKWPTQDSYFIAVSTIENARSTNVELSNARFPAGNNIVITPDNLICFLCQSENVTAPQPLTERCEDCFSLTSTDLASLTIEQRPKKIDITADLLENATDEERLAFSLFFDSDGNPTMPSPQQLDELFDSTSNNISIVDILNVSSSSSTVSTIDDQKTNLVLKLSPQSTFHEFRVTKEAPCDTLKEANSPIDIDEGSFLGGNPFDSNSTSNSRNDQGANQRSLKSINRPDEQTLRSPLITFNICLFLVALIGGWRMTIVDTSFLLLVTCSIVSVVIGAMWITDLSIATSVVGGRESVLNFVSNLANDFLSIRLDFWRRQYAHRCLLDTGVWLASSGAVLFLCAICRQICELFKYFRDKKEAEERAAAAAAGAASASAPKDTGDDVTSSFIYHSCLSVGAGSASVSAICLLYGLFSALVISFGPPEAYALVNTTTTANSDNSSNSSLNKPITNFNASNNNSSNTTANTTSEQNIDPIDDNAKKFVTIIAGLVQQYGDLVYLCGGITVAFIAAMWVGWMVRVLQSRCQMNLESLMYRIHFGDVPPPITTVANGTERTRYRANMSEQSWHVILILVIICNCLLLSFYTVLSGSTLAFLNGLPDKPTLAFMLMICAQILSAIFAKLTLMYIQWQITFLPCNDSADFLTAIENEESLSRLKRAPTLIPLLFGVPSSAVFLVALSWSLPPNIHETATFVFVTTALSISCISLKSCSSTIQRQELVDQNRMNRTRDKYLADTPTASKEIDENEKDLIAFQNDGGLVKSVQLDYFHFKERWINAWNTHLWLRMLVSLLQLATLTTTAAIVLGINFFHRKSTQVRIDDFVNETIQQKANTTISAVDNSSTTPPTGFFALLGAIADKQEESLNLSAVSFALVLVSAVVKIVGFVILAVFCREGDMDKWDLATMVMDLRPADTRDQENAIIDSNAFRYIRYAFRAARLAAALAVLFPVIAVGVVIFADYMKFLGKDFIPQCTVAFQGGIFSIVHFAVSTAVNLFTASAAFVAILALGVTMLEGFTKQFEAIHPVMSKQYFWFVSLASCPTTVFLLSAIQLAFQSEIARIFSIIALVFPSLVFLAIPHPAVFGPCTYLMPGLTAYFSLSSAGLIDAIINYVGELQLFWIIFGALGNFLLTLTAFGDLVNLLQVVE